jgi:hypothetical protein
MTLHNTTVLKSRRRKTFHLDTGTGVGALVSGMRRKISGRTNGVEPIYIRCSSA